MVLPRTGQPLSCKLCLPYTWVISLIKYRMSLSIATFAFIGVEIPAACALEAQAPRDTQRQHDQDQVQDQERDPDRERTRIRGSAIGATVKNSAIWIPFLAALCYVIAGTLVTVNVRWNSCLLPRLSWADKSINECTLPNGSFTFLKPGQPNPPGINLINSTESAFVISTAEMSTTLAGTLNVFLMFTALSCANTNLYVASRNLFSLTRGLDSGPNQKWYIRCLAWIGRTNHRYVPLRAMLVSCIFAWIPFLYLSKRNGPNTSIGTVSRPLWHDI
jgi:amino acid transporter